MEGADFLRLSNSNSREAFEGKIVKYEFWYICSHITLLTAQLIETAFMIWISGFLCMLEPNCEAQGKRRAMGPLRKVTQRSFIDYRLSIVDVDFPEALHYI